MKVDLIKKYKWYIFGAIAVVLIMSIGLSFCAWDNKSILSSASGKVADYEKVPTYANKVVGDVFADSTGLQWLVVDKTVTNGVTDIVLMTYRLTEARAYELTQTNPDYNSPKNNIRVYLNGTWYPKIGQEVRQHAVQRLTTYASVAEYPSNKLLPTFVAPTLNYAWLPLANEVGLFVTNWDESFLHGTKFQYFKRNDTTPVHDGGGDPCRIALDNAGIARKWWTRSPTYATYATTIGETGGAQMKALDNISLANWLRPCVQVRYCA